MFIVTTGDFNGDGTTDLVWYKASTFKAEVFLSSGNGSFADRVIFSDGVDQTGFSLRAGDFNGDGMTDLVWVRANTFLTRIYLANGDGSFATRIATSDTSDNTGYALLTGDFNGDGLTDLAYVRGNTFNARIWLAMGDGKLATRIGTSDTPDFTGYFLTAGDFNGDGMTDLMWVRANTFATRTYIAKGDGKFAARLPFSDSLNYTGYTFTTGDINGDGNTDAIWYKAKLFKTYIYHGNPLSPPNLLSTVENGIGGRTIFTYTPSSRYLNFTLPFIIQTLSSKDVDDGNGTVSTTSYTYSGGLYDPGDREFRGFSTVKTTNPTGSIVESRYYQDNIFKGLEYYHSVISLGISGELYLNNYYSKNYDAVSPYNGVSFPRLITMGSFSDEGNQQITTTFGYDSYGNITSKYAMGCFWGDFPVCGDHKNEYAEYSVDLAQWIFRPSHTYVVDEAGATKAQTWYTYDTKGNLLTKTAWLEGGTNPVITYTYNDYGNQTSITDPKGRVTTIGYDSTYTYPTTVTNALGHMAIKTYDLRFGKPLTETDSNGNTTTYEYDVFGRLKKVTNPYDTSSTHGTVSYFYEKFGTVGQQHIKTYATEQSGTGNYLWKEAYFDGLGRNIKTRTEGPDNKVIVTDTVMNNKGLVEKTSMPYFEGIETPRWTTFTYDPISRVTGVTYPDGTTALASYMKGRATFVDANGHMKIEEKNGFGRLIKVEEYAGNYPYYPLYATTTYQYNILGNLLKVTDTLGNQTTMTYDTLSRKTSMNDPDMGYWTYSYDANGNLTSQTDAKNQTITFTYDALNRMTKKDYPTGTDVIYTYDETFSTNPKERLTTVTDASGTTKFYYDKLGRTTKTIKTVDGINYTTESTYDALSRTTSIKYPDNEIVNYTYDTGGNLSGVTGFVTFTNYNALGQHGTATYANGVSTSYQYYTTNNRLYSIITNKSTTKLQDLSYQYDNAGNITTLSDYIDSARTQNFTYDHLSRLTQAQSGAYGTLTYQYNEIGNMMYNSQLGSYNYGTKPHAVIQAGPNSYTYDANGNMISRPGQTITYDYENRPVSINSTVFVYDYSGQRVKKNSTIYIGKLYECTGGTCTKYIFAGGNRIASKTGTVAYYYHTDHLGSSSVITDSAGNKVQETHYFPFGGTRFNSGNVVKHKYTGQEEDPETGLYYYNARYYDPQLGRFISADSIVPEPFDPQSLNRYTYVLNNPIMYTDPTGHAEIEIICCGGGGGGGGWYGGDPWYQTPSWRDREAYYEWLARESASSRHNHGDHRPRSPKVRGVSSASSSSPSFVTWNMGYGNSLYTSGGIAGSWNPENSNIAQNIGWYPVGTEKRPSQNTNLNPYASNYYSRLMTVADISEKASVDLNVNSSSPLTGDFLTDASAGLGYFCNCMADYIIAPGLSTWLEALAKSGEFFLTSSAWQHAAITPSSSQKLFKGMKALPYPMRSSIVQNRLRWARATGGIAVGIWIWSTGNCLIEEYEYFSR